MSNKLLLRLPIYDLQCQPLIIIITARTCISLVIKLIFAVGNTLLFEENIKIVKSITDLVLYRDIHTYTTNCCITLHRNRIDGQLRSSYR